MGLLDNLGGTTGQLDGSTANPKAALVQAVLGMLVHGNEPVPSIGIIRAVLEQLNPAELRGTVLAVSTDELPEPTDDDEFYDHQLIDLAVVGVDGRALGTVVEVLHPPAAPVEQPGTQLAFQAVDPLEERGRGHAQLRGRGRVRHGVGDGHERRDEAKVE